MNDHDLPSSSGVANLLYDLDKKVMVLLSDGRTLFGWLRMVDRFGNMVLQCTIERIFVGNCYGDIIRGVYIIRGDNVVLVGEIDHEKENNLPLRQKPLDDVLEAQSDLLEKRQEMRSLRRKFMEQYGLPINRNEDDSMTENSY